MMKWKERRERGEDVGVGGYVSAHATQSFLSLHESHRRSYYTEGGQKMGKGDAIPLRGAGAECGHIIWSWYGQSYG